GRPAVAAAEERGRRAAEPERLRLVRVARLDVPGLLPGQAALLGQPDLLGALPGLAEVARAVRRRAVDRVVRRRMQRPRARVAHRVEDLPAGEMRALDRPIAAGFVAGQDEQALLGTDEDGSSHRATSLTKQKGEQW